MAKKKRTPGAKKRTLTPEHLAKMQAGRRRAKVHRGYMEELESRGLGIREAGPSYVERLLDSVRRN